MNTGNQPNWGGPGIGQRIDAAIEQIQAELRHAVAYVNDAVIPEVRRESIQGLRTAAEALRNLADRVERHANAASGAQAGAEQVHTQESSGESCR